MSKNYAKFSAKKESRHRKNQTSSRSGYFVILLLLIIGITSYYVFSRGIFMTSTQDSLSAQPTHKKASNIVPVSQPSKPRFEFYTVLSHETVPVPHEKGESINTVTADATTTEPPLPQSNKPSNDKKSLTSKTESSADIAPTGVPAVNIPVTTPTSSGNSLKKTTISSQSLSKATTNTPPSSIMSDTEKSGRYVLQVAALQHLQDIDQIKAKLTFLGFNVIVEPFQSLGTTWYRIKVGPFLSEDKMQKARQVLIHNHLSSIVITLPSTYK